jgi:hypothetical protein
MMMMMMSATGERARCDAELADDERTLVSRESAGMRKLGGRCRAVDETNTVTDVLTRHMQRHRHTLRPRPAPWRALDHYVDSLLCASPPSSSSSKKSAHADVLCELASRTTFSSSSSSSSSSKRTHLSALGVSDAAAALVELAQTIRSPAYRYQKCVS